MNNVPATSSQTQPLVFVVTPTYNQAAFLRDTIESVLSQDYQAIEYQIIDDGSTDETPRILEEYAGRAWIERHGNRGQTPTINKGWERAAGGPQRAVPGRRDRPHGCGLELRGSIIL